MWMKLTCTRCGKEFLRQRCEILRSIERGCQSFYCEKSCQRRDDKYDQTKVCLHCGRKVKRRRWLSETQWKEAKYCTRRCSALAQGSMKVEVACVICGKKRMVKRSAASGSKYCSWGHANIGRSRWKFKARRCVGCDCLFNPLTNAQIFHNRDCFYLNASKIHKNRFDGWEGRKFYCWTILTIKEKGKAFCRCDCGVIRLCELKNIEIGKSKSCGCHRRDWQDVIIKNLSPSGHCHHCGKKTTEDGIFCVGKCRYRYLRSYRPVERINRKTFLGGISYVAQV